MCCWRTSGRRSLFCVCDSVFFRWHPGSDIRDKPGPTPKAAAGSLGQPTPQPAADCRTSISRLIPGVPADPGDEKPVTAEGEARLWPSGPKPPRFRPSPPEEAPRFVPCSARLPARRAAQAHESKASFRGQTSRRFYIRTDESRYTSRARRCGSRPPDLTTRASPA